MLGEIKKYVKKGYISFHTPAHKGRNPYINKVLKPRYDLTELMETDNLFCPDGIIKNLENNLAKVFLSKEFFILVNGATSGIEAAINLFKEGDKILIDRNCHISVVNGLILSGATPVFIETSLNEFNIPNPPTLDAVEKAFLENSDAKGLFITSPNYYGLSAELKKIASFCRKKYLISIADEAHGGHFYYIKDKETAINAGFDISVLSFHKNLPGLTQTGGLLVNNSDLAVKIKENLRRFTSTSPSYILMLSLDAMQRYMKLRGRMKLKSSWKHCEKVKKELLEKGIKILDSQDPTRFVINCKDADKKAIEIKDKYKIVCEMSDKENITFIISLHNKKREINLLKDVILKELCDPCDSKGEFSLPKFRITPTEANFSKFAYTDTEKANGLISGEYIIDFPPSVPIIIPGEEINEQIIEKIKEKKDRIKYVL